MTNFKIGDPVVLTQPWYRRGRVHTISSIDASSATVKDGNRYIGVSVDDLRPAEGAELLVTPYDLTTEQIVAYECRLPPQDPLQPESQTRRDCFTAARCLDEVARFEARARIARAINEYILQGGAEGGSAGPCVVSGDLCRGAV